MNVPDHVSRCLQLAVLLEVSAYPKPGNVHRTADFADTRYEHFLASAVVLASAFREAAQRGILAARREIPLEELEVGRLIKEAVGQVKAWQGGGNTLLGTIILLMPMASAAGVTLTQGTFSVSKFRGNLKRVVESTTPRDAVNLYDAISVAEPGGLGHAPRLDIAEPGSKEKILEEKTTLFEVFKISSSWDSISSEWVNNYPVTFDLGYPYFVDMLERAENVNTATVHTFLKILSEVPDTLIARKLGQAKAKEVSARALEVLEAGGLTSKKGREELLRFDLELRDAEHRLNPGATADLTAAVLAVAVLGGYRP
jgi:triphosphoribosyl-dephospho-CoA synthase